MAKINYNLIIFSIILFSCAAPDPAAKEVVKPPAAEKTNVEKTAIQYLFSKIKSGNKALLNSDEITIGDTSIKIKATVDLDGQKEGKYIYSANFSTVFKAADTAEINIVSIGIGANSDEAVSVCIHEWFAAFGTSFTNMLNDTNDIVIGDLQIFPGLMGIRGALPDNTWLDGSKGMNQKILKQIKDKIAVKEKNIVSVDIKIMVGPDGLMNGKCLVGDNVSDDLLNELKKLNWPKSADPFMFKQFYLITGKGK